MRLPLRGAGRALALILGAAFAIIGSSGASVAEGAGASYCAPISNGLRDGEGPMLLASFVEAEEGPRLDPSLKGAAFVYDNALAAIALVACGDLRGAKRIGDALIFASEHDRFYPAGQVRNAYLAGPMSEAPARLAGWWNEAEKKWIEDETQVGSSTGNVAWAGLALLNLYAATGEAKYLEGAERVLEWIMTLGSLSGDLTEDALGIRGGIHGFEPNETYLPWKSTEHNVDVGAAFLWLAEIHKDDPLRAAKWSGGAQRTRDFVASMFDEADGRFFIGTEPDGKTPTPSNPGLDCQLWPLIAFADAPPSWHRAVAWAELHHGVNGGFDFNDDRDGIWIEGTAQAALTYRAIGSEAKARAALALIGQHQHASGYLYAIAGGGKLTTGLALGPQSTDADFVYYPWPHLGATAWAALAAEGFNPFTGKRVGQ